MAALSFIRVPSAAEGPSDGRLPKRISDTYGEDDFRVELVFYSTFEPLDLPCSGPMEAQGMPKFYEPLPTPVLYGGQFSMFGGACP